MALVDRDEEHLRIISACQCAFAAICALVGCFPILHVTIGILVLSGVLPLKDTDFPKTLFGIIFIVIGGLLILGFWTTALLSFFTGRFLTRRRHWVFCAIVAGIQCAAPPFGSVLGVFTLIVLLRPEVKARFNSGAPPPVPNVSGQTPTH